MVGNLCRSTAVAVLAVSAVARADDWPPRLVGSFAAPPGAIALACEYQPLYALVGGATPTVFTLITWNGSITGSFNVPVPNGARGIATTGGYPTEMWVSNRLNGFLYRLDTTGSLVGSFACPGGTPYGLGGYLYGGGPDRGYLTVSCRDENDVLRVNLTTGSLASSFPGPATAVIGYDEGLAVDRYKYDLYWNYYGDWEVLDTLPARPWGVTTAVAGTTYGAGSVTAYVLCRNGYIYRYHGIKDDAVAPASLGRVKALFR
jgi:hypothetical protein